MSDQSIRDAFAYFIAHECSEEPMWSAVVIANTFLASPLFRRIQAEAWDEGHTHCFHVEDPNNPSKSNPYREES